MRNIDPAFISSSCDTPNSKFIAGAEGTSDLCKLPKAVSEAICLGSPAPGRAHRIRAMWVLDYRILMSKPFQIDLY